MSSKMFLSKLSTNPDLSNFSCGVKSIDYKIKDMYFAHILKQGTAFEIILSDNGNNSITVGYIFITFIRIPFEDYDYQSNLMHEYFPAAYIDFIAINKLFQGKRLGSTALDILIESLKLSEQQIDFRFIIVDAFIDKKSFYSRLGFKCFFDNNNSQQTHTITMYYDLIKKNEESRIDEYVNSILE